MSMNFDEWYKKSIEEHREEPPGFVWNEIESRMDIADVWSNINMEFDRREDRKIRSWTRWSVAAAAILVFVSLNLRVPNGYLANYSQLQMPEIEQDRSGTTSVKTASLQKPAIKYITTEVSQSEMLKSQMAAALYENEIIASPSEVATIERSRINTTLDIVTAQRVFAHTAPRGMQFLSPMNEFERENGYYKLPLKKRISMGVIGSYNNTWILSRQKFDQVSDAEASSSISGLGKNIGLIASIDYSKSFTVQAELVHTETSQNYKKTFSDKFSPDELLVNYLTFNLLMVHKHHHFFDDIPASHNFIAGGGFGYLTSAKLRQGTFRTDVKEKYTKENISLSLGYEYELHPVKSWSIAAGLRANYGLSNVERVVYSEFNDQRSNTFSWGGHIMVKYHLGY